MKLFLVLLCIQLSFAEKPPLYQEKLRPRFHFTANTGYLNDPNGLFFLNGTYHLFFQHDGIREKKWGHATSTDLLHWTQHPDALVPLNNHPVFSGSAAIDHLNTTGFGTAENPPVVACFTEWGLGQSLAYSTDQGKTWTRYSGNPVLKRPNDEKADFALSSRDPHIMWDAPRRRWVLVMFDNPTGKKKSSNNDHRHGFSIFTSPNLIDWTYRSHLDNFYVCPDVFQLPLENTDTTKWIAMDWDRYTVGHFDGETFTPQQPIAPLDQGPSQSLSANQSWKHLPDGRTIQISWIRDGKYPGMPFEQQLSFPVELSLRQIGDHTRLCKNPIRELPTLYGKKSTLTGNTIPTTSQSFDLQLEATLKKDDTITLLVLGQSLTISQTSITVLNQKGTLHSPFRNIRILADLTSLEIFANDGETTMTFTLLPPGTPANITLKTTGTPTIQKAHLHPINSIWKP